MNPFLRKDFMKPIRSSLCLAALGALLACAPTWADERAPLKKPRLVQKLRLPATNAEVPPASAADQEGQGVYQLLLAEIALQRGDADFAARAYADLATRTRDPQVLERAVEIAGFAQRFDLATDTAKLWLDIEPDSTRARQMLTGVLIRNNQLDDLAPHLKRSLDADPAALRGNLLGINRLFAANNDRQAVFRLIDEVCRSYGDLAEAHYAVAVAAASASLNERAKDEVQQALKLSPDWDLAILLKAQILANESPIVAIGYMQTSLVAHPEFPDLRLLLARALIAERRYEEARTQFDELLKGYPDRPEVIYPVALLALQQGDLDLAERQLQHLAELNIPDKELAYYYLGQIAEERGNKDEALAFYDRVGTGEQYVPAHLRAANLLAESGKLDEARHLLFVARAAMPVHAVEIALAEAGILRKAKRFDEAYALLDAQLANKPDDTDLLYDSALLAEQVGKLDVMERRLRRLIELKPESAHAHNALGYAFADHRMHLAEARRLIEKALKLSPDDAFIVDSMGWVLFRMGDLDGAQAQLRRAYALRDDPEIAAHLAEVLVAAGQRDEAKTLLREAVGKHPNNDMLQDAVRKFGQ